MIVRLAKKEIKKAVWLDRGVMAVAVGRKSQESRLLSDVVGLSHGYGRMSRGLIYSTSSP